MVPRDAEGANARHPQAPLPATGVHGSMGSVQNSDIILETQRLTLRRQQASDVAPLVDLWTDPEVTRYMGGPRDRDWLQSVFEETAQNPYAERYDLWPVVEKETCQVVGHCGLLEKEVQGSAEIELNYILATSAWGKGYATEIGQALREYAFREMGVERLIALIDPQNASSARVALRIGMRLEREIVRPGGARRKLYIMEAGDK
jgi:ribosomal-protein-alanine N-acetyltransferase